VVTDRVVQAALKLMIEVTHLGERPSSATT